MKRFREMEQWIVLGFSGLLVVAVIWNIIGLSADFVGRAIVAIAMFLEIKADESVGGFLVFMALKYLNLAEKNAVPWQWLLKGAGIFILWQIASFRWRCWECWDLYPARELREKNQKTP